MRLHQVHDSKAASAAWELDADMQSIFSVAIHKKAVRKVYAREENKVMFLPQGCHKPAEKNTPRH